MATTARARTKARSMTLGEFAAEIEALYVERRARGELVASTLSNVRRVLRLLAELGIETTADIGDETCSRLDGHIGATLPHLGTRGRLNLLRTLRAICGHAVELRLMRRMPDFPAIADPRKLPRPDGPSLSTATVTRLRDHLATGLETFPGHRLYALFMVVVYAGLRLGEALDLEVTDIDPAARTIRVRRREGKQRTRFPSPVPIADELMPALEGWLRVTGPRFVFRGIYKDKPWRNTGLPGYAPLGQLQDAARAAGIRERVTFEALYWWYVERGRHAAISLEPRDTAPATRPKSATSTGRSVTIGRREVTVTSDEQARVLEVLKRATRPLSLVEIGEEAGVKSPWHVMDKLRKHPVLRTAIAEEPGEFGRKTYRLVYKR